MFKQTHIGQKLVNATAMTRQQYNDFRGWTLSENEAGMGDDDGYMVEYEPHPTNKPNVEGYDGYVTWSPKAVFDDAYKSLDSMTFGDAVMMLKRGAMVARKGWNGKGLKLRLVLPNDNSDMTLPYVAMLYPSTPASDTAPVNHINASVPWLASQTDLLAEDWVLVD